MPTKTTSIKESVKKKKKKMIHMMAIQDVHLACRLEGLID